jgi:hypothetical protein
VADLNLSSQIYEDDDVSDGPVLTEEYKPRLNVTGLFHSRERYVMSA